MQCEDFLEGYSEFMDGRLAPSEHEAFDRHLEACDACARYHRVVQRGLFIWRNLPDLHPSPDFLPRLRHRLFHVDDEARLAPRTLGSAALIAVAAVGMLALAWLPFATRVAVEVELPPVAVETPTPRSTPAASPSLFGPGPFLTPLVGYEGTGYEGAPPAWSASAPTGNSFFQVREPARTGIRPTPARLER